MSEGCYAVEPQPDEITLLPSVLSAVDQREHDGRQRNWIGCIVCEHSRHVVLAGQHPAIAPIRHSAAVKD